MQKVDDYDLISQQHHLASSSYDLRISNLARFVHKLVRHSDSTSDAQRLHTFDAQERRDSETQALKQSGNNSQSKKENVSGSTLHPPIRRAGATRLRLLDVGAGNGLILKFFKSVGYEIHGVELEQELVENMRRDPALNGVDIRQGSITEMKGDASYDVVIASDVIEHIKDDITALKNLWSFVRPGGQLVITVPAFQFLYGKRDKAWGHFRRYDRALMKDHIAQAGLDRIGEMKMCYWNIIGFFVYGFYEKILGRPINETMRKSNSPLSRFVRGVLDAILRIEELIGGLPFGLTLVCVIRKSN